MLMQKVVYRGTYSSVLCGIVTRSQNSARRHESPPVDVGNFMMDDSCRYFVNKVTRIYEVDFFAEWLAQPGTHICRAVAAALGKVFIDVSNRKQRHCFSLSLIVQARLYPITSATSAGRCFLIDHW